LRAARRPAASPSKLNTTVGEAKQLLHMVGVQAVPSVATALGNPSWASATTSM
jgi:hypothetical protein